ncbi:MAG: molybdopterin molybdotransferase MoeA [Syntrophobacterales bacterium]|jgi:molybdopterin molybdotransferase|nr:molybdopterin molybdotransferase MoeA [Syntrophobacterales bacterium]
MTPLEFFRLQTRQEVLALYERFLPVGTEQVELAAAQGRVTVAAITAPEAVPGFLRATMDGYAVRAQDTFGASVGAPQYLEVKGEVPMGAAPERGVGPGETLRVATGAMLPNGADAVVMLEYTAEHPDGTLEVRRAVAPGENVLAPGEDVARGEVIFPAGRRLRPQEVGLLAALGLTAVTVYRKPRVAILSSGDEIVPLEGRPRPGQVRDSNAYLAAAQVAEWGGLPLMQGIVPDDFAALRGALAQALEAADLILVSGGSSVGVRDLTLNAIQDLPGADVLVHGVALRPGKPTILASLGTPGLKPLLGLPGHPASAAVVMEVLGRPLLTRLAGLTDPASWGRSVSARLSRNLAGATGREDYVRVRLRRDDHIVWADPVLGPSGLLSPLVKSDGLVMIPLGVEGLFKGEEVMVQLFGWS